MQIKCKTELMCTFETTLKQCEVYAMKSKCKMKFMCAFEMIYLKYARVSANKPNAKNSFCAYLKQVEATTRVNAMQIKCKIELWCLFETRLRYYNANAMQIKCKLEILYLL